MACIVYQTNKKTGVKYAYSSESYYDPEKKQARSRRKYIGKVDPVSGEIIRKEDTTNTNEKTAELKKTISDYEKKIKELNQTILELKNKCEEKQNQLNQIAAIIHKTTK